MPVSINFQFHGKSIRAKDRHLLSFFDGDSVSIQQPIRLVSCDTPEKAGYAGGAEIAQPKLDKCKQRLTNGFYNEIPSELRDYLVEKLEPTTAHDHISAGNKATSKLENMLETRLGKDGDGYEKKLAVIPAQPFIETNNRVLAYIAPWFKKKEGQPIPDRDDPRRRTFNIDMIRDGWAASFIIYPTIPRKSDLEKLLNDAESAWTSKKGVWEIYGEKFLLAYEYRTCIKLANAETAKDGINNAFERVCFDLRNMNEVGVFGFHDIPPCYRLWAWKSDIDQARKDLGVNAT